MPIHSFDLKEILKNPRQLCIQRWPDADEAEKQLAAAKTLIDAIAAIKPDLKQKKSEKQESARDFGRAKAKGADLAVHKARMQKVSRELAELEYKQRELESELLDLFAAPMAMPRIFPERFDPCIRPGAEAIEIETMQDKDRDAWNRYVDAHPQASLYHRYQWRTVIETSFGHECFYLAAKDAGGQIRGLLPLVRLRSRLFGDFAISIPFFNYGGPLADTPEIARQLLEAAASLAQSHQLKHLEIRCTQTLHSWPARTDKVSMILRLPSSADRLDEEIGAKVRAQIKRAQQEPAHICIGHLDLLDDFYRVFAINMRDLGTPVYGKNFFRNILSELPAQSHIVVVRLHGRPVSAAFLLGYRDMMEIPWASTLRTVNALNINMLLYRAVLGFCIERGYTFFDFGRSTADSGTFRFKRQWGAQPLQHSWHYWLPHGGELPALKPDSPKFRLLIAAWQKLPVSISKLIGPHIVKYLP